MTVIRTLTKAEESDKIGAGSARTAPGAMVQLWQLDGLWRVWSSGPKRGSWWLVAGDDDARAVLDTMRTGVSAAPVVFDEYRTERTHAIAVASRDIRPHVVVRGEA